MEGNKVQPKPIKYNPNPENYAFLLNTQKEKRLGGTTVGLDRIVDQFINKARKAADTPQEN